MPKINEIVRDRLMKFAYINKIITGLFITIFIGVISVFGYMWFEARREYWIFENQERKLEAELFRARESYEVSKAYLTRFFMDPNFCEWVVRDRLGYAAPDELVFHFDEAGAVKGGY